MSNRRVHLVVDKQFQYHYALGVVALAVIIVNIFFVVRMLDVGEKQLLMSNVSALGLAGIELFLIVGVWFGSLKASNKIAGPVFVIAREIEKLGHGDFSAHIDLRRKDMFHRMTDEMNENFVALRTRMKSLKDIAQQLDEAAERGEDTRELLAKLKEELSSLTIEEAEQ